jgi:hypothetical protein
MVKLIVETPEGSREIESTKLSSEEIEQRLRTYDLTLTPTGTFCQMADEVVS